MSFNTLLNDSIIEVDMDAKTKEELFAKIAKSLQDNDRLKSADAFIADMKKQESLSTTNMGHGVALPIAHSIAVKKTTFMLIKLENEIDWEDFGTPINLVFVLVGVHSSVIEEHKSFLLKLNSLINNKSFVGVMNGTKKPSVLLHRLKMAMGI